MAQVEFRNVVKNYGSFEAVKDVSFTVEDGEFVALVGPSGCGKTTTLNLMAGLLELTDGEIKVSGKVINDLDPKDRDIAMVFQNYALYPNKTVRQNLGFPLKMRKMPAKQLNEKVDEAAKLLREEVIERGEPREEARDLFVPGLGRGVVPHLRAAGLREHPRHEVTHVREHLQGRAGRFSDLEVTEPVRSAAQGLSSAIGEGGDGVAEEGSGVRHVILRARSGGAGTQLALMLGDPPRVLLLRGSHKAARSPGPSICRAALYPSEPQPT